MNQFTTYLSRPLKDHPYANAKVLETDDGVILQSYNTVVAKIADCKAYCYGLHSPTTRHHISYFAHEFGLSYWVFKKVFEDGFEYYDISAKQFVD